VGSSIPIPVHRHPRVSAGRSFLSAFVRDLIALELAAVDDAAAERTRAWVVARVDGAAEITRLGMMLVGTLIAAAVRASTGRAYAALPDRRRLRIARRLASTRVPLAGDYVRAVRALTVSHAYERLGEAP
jgi:hypothetical protein